MSLSMEVLRFVREARKRPALAVGEALDALEQQASASFDGGFATLTSPVAPLTWMTRSLLPITEQESQPDVVKLGEPIEIVGALPTVFKTSIAGTTPPLEAIDVFLELNRREQLTAQGEKGTTIGRDRTVVNLPMISVLAPRLMGLYLGAADPVLEVKFRWAIPFADIAALGFGDVQVSLGFFVRPLIPDRRSALRRST